MRRVSDGYTIIEVMIFLAVSAILMLSAFRLIGGKQAQTDFNQKARDTQSQLQTWFTSSASGFTGADPTSQHCESSGNRPVIKSGPSSSIPNYNSPCVFLGEAIQFTDKSQGADQSTIYAYPVFGCRITACALSGALPTDLRQSDPEPAAGIDNGLALTQTFSLLPLYVYSVKSTGLDCSATPCFASTNTTSHLVGFYGSINAGGAVNGQSDINAYQYDCGGSRTPGGQCISGGSTVFDCIKMSSSCGISPTGNGYPDTLKQLDVCLTDGSRYAQLLINSSGGIGADITLNYLNSPANC